MLTLAEIMEIIKAINESAITRFELEQGGTRLAIAKDGGGAPVTTTIATAGPAAARPEERPDPDGGAGCHKITAPMIGTFYAAPEPGARPFAEPGQKVSADTVVCVLEVMKLFNEVEAGVEGEIVEVLVRDGELVEYGQPLFVVREEQRS
ncbi:acetyl-CoA carboxylase biotin carboxyl carrier protein [Sporomusa termitida]|uniref:Biotin carboxyl carrier protein of acetyl-CoA carboxylase n=1 Tax=Sporomusa termitida TaxID=2377 RepID=A0A517DYC4_9FIRM|nr:acetyl-CoA carboxylase biotin carboxyl carrier protein [Sporomusa termitida]QDR82342.1 Biotin carboxyl carrier protein of acetyl-CoA carboxylase [Sporomusa termitida]